MSDKAPFGTPSEKGRAGTVHLALGDNHNAYPGGQNVVLAPPRRRLPQRHDADRRRRHVHPARRPVGAVTAVAVVPLEAVGDRSSCRAAAGAACSSPTSACRATASSLGYSVFAPGTAAAPVRHETEEVAYVVTGHGRAAARRRGRGLRARRRALHPGRRLARGREHRGRRRGHGVRLPAARPIRRPSGAARHGGRRPSRSASRSPGPAASSRSRATPTSRSATSAAGYRASDIVQIKRKGVALDEVEAGRRDRARPRRTTASRSRPTCTSRRCCTARSTGARPDVGAVVHGHPPYATALRGHRRDARAPDARLGAVRRRPGRLRGDAGADHRGRAGPRRGARRSAAARAVILRNHGVLVVGKDVPWAVLTAVTLERAIRLQSHRPTLGDAAPDPGRPGRAHVAPTKYQDRFVDEYWAAWIRRARARRGRPPDGRRMNLELDGQRPRPWCARSSRRSCCSTSCATGSA